MTLNGPAARSTPSPRFHVLPMHCSGQNFIDLAKQEMPEKLVLCETGSRFTFTA